jgi:hypothetical protein
MYENEDQINNIKVETDIKLDISLETVDETVLNWLKDDVQLLISGESDEQIQVPVVLAPYEKWSRANKGSDRDKFGKVVFPIIVIRRVSEMMDIGRTIPIIDSTNIQIIKQLNPEISSAYLQSPSHKNNIPVYDVYSIPFPNFININYSIHIFTKFMIQQNQILMQILNNPKTSYRSFWIEGEHCRYLVEINDISDSSNIDDFSDGERILQKIISLTVHAYVMPELKNKDNTVKHSRTYTRVEFNEDIAT